MAIFWGGVGDWLAGRGIRWQSFVLFNVLEQMIMKAKAEDGARPRRRHGARCGGFCLQ